MHQAIMFLLLGISLWSHSVDSICSPTSGDIPTFSPPMNESVPAISGRLKRLFCCLYGVKKITWTFTNEVGLKNTTIILPLKKVYRLTHDRRILTIRNPRAPADTGIYRCEGNSSRGEFLAGETFLRVAFPRSNFNFKLIGSSNTSKKAFAIMSSHTMFCIVSAHQSLSPHFMWRREIHNKSLPIIREGYLHSHKLRGSLIRGFKGYSLLRKTKYRRSFLTYNFTLTLLNLDATHGGLYSCQINDGKKNIIETIPLYILKKGEPPIYVLSGIMIWCLVCSLLIYIFQYDIRLVIKSAIRNFISGKNSSRKYDFFFLYNFDDSTDLRYIQKVIKHVEERGFIAYFHHRDQTYGKDKMSCLHTGLVGSDVAVVWTSSSLFNNPIAMACINMLNNCKKTKRIYIIVESKHQISANSGSKSVLTDLKSCGTTKSFHFNPAKETILMRWHSHQLISWLISCLPIKREGFQ